jgi:undecaprenyl diphosphate synthase
MNKPGNEPLVNVPRHVAIIMDGNNRWAKKRKLPGSSGHKAGVEQIRTILRACERHGVEALTLFAFSSENWQRPRKEVDALMGLFQSYLNNEVSKLLEENVRLRVIGSRDRFTPNILKAMEAAEEATAHCEGRTLVIAADYGGRWDIAQTAKDLARKAVAGELDIEAINEDLFTERMTLADLPQPDLCIRTGGDHRISNFLLWQFAYTELYFTETFWPDFSEQDFDLAIRDFASRQRRFGKSGDQVEGVHA